MLWDLSKESTYLVSQEHIDRNACDLYVPNYQNGYREKSQNDTIRVIFKIDNCIYIHEKKSEENKFQLKLKHELINIDVSKVFISPKNRIIEVNLN